MNGDLPLSTYPSTIPIHIYIPFYLLLIHVSTYLQESRQSLDKINATLAKRTRDHSTQSQEFFTRELQLFGEINESIQHTYAAIQQMVTIYEGYLDICNKAKEKGKLSKLLNTKKRQKTFSGERVSECIVTEYILVF